MNNSSQYKIISVNELWQFFNRSANLFCITGPDGYLRQINPHFVELLGFSEEQLLSTPYKHFIHEGDWEFTANQSAKVRKEIPSIQFRNRILDSSGSFRWISWTATFIEDEDNVYLIGQDYTETHLVEERLIREKRGKHKMVMEATLMGQEKERRELGRELHDNINQILATAIMHQKMALQEDSNCREMIIKTGEIIEIAISEIRCLSKSLVGPDVKQIGLLDCIRELLDMVSLTTKITVEFKFTGEFEDLPIKVKLMIFRIIQEQINNIIKHAEAWKIFVLLMMDENYLTLEINDDGVGFDMIEKPNGIGLKNIKSRVEIYDGTLDIKSAVNKGCNLKVIIPVITISENTSIEERL